MKLTLKRKYKILIAAMVVIVFIFSFFYFSKLGLPIANTAPTTETTEDVEKIPPEELPFHRTIEIYSSSCIVSGVNDTIKFKIRATGIYIGPGQLVTFVDDEPVSNKVADSSGLVISDYSLNANAVSNEFSYTAPDHKPVRKLLVASPAETLTQNVNC